MNEVLLRKYVRNILKEHYKKRLLNEVLPLLAIAAQQVGRHAAKNVAKYAVKKMIKGFAKKKIKKQIVKKTKDTAKSAIKKVKDSSRSNREQEIRKKILDIQTQQTSEELK